MVQILQPQPTTRTLRQQAFQDGVDQLGQGIVGFANAQDQNQKTQRQQAFEVLKTTADLRQSGFDVTPDQVASQFQQADSGGMFSRLFGGSEAQQPAPMENIFSQRTPEYMQKQEDANIDRQLKRAQLDELGKPFTQTRKGQEFLVKEDIDNEQKRREKEEKALAENEKAVVEVENRKRNILENIDLMEKQIKEYGTYEMFGPQNENLDRWGDAIATDMSKLMDPQSVARPSEVEMVKKTLVSPSAKDMRNSTALTLLKNLRQDVENRARTAYEVRGLKSGQKSGLNSNSKPRTVIQNGHTYTLNESTGEYE